MLLRINEFSGYANYCHRFCSSPLNIQITELKSQSSSWLIFKWRKTNDVCTKFPSTFGWLSPMNNQLDYLKNKNTDLTKIFVMLLFYAEDIRQNTFISFHQMHFCNIFQALRSPKVLHGEKTYGYSNSLLYTPRNLLVPYEYSKSIFSF